MTPQMAERLRASLRHALDGMVQRKLVPHGGFTSRHHLAKACLRYARELANIAADPGQLPELREHAAEGAVAFSSMYVTLAVHAEGDPDHEALIEDELRRLAERVAPVN